MAAALERALGVAERPGRPSEEPLLLLGPAGSGRTALLLRAALAGGGTGPRALLLAPAAIPSLPCGADPRALQRLELRYPPSLGALRRELGAAASSHPRRPGLLLLDGLERYLAGEEGGGETGGGVAHLAALLLETARSPGPPVPPAQLLVSLRLPPPGPRVLPILRRYFPAECRLRPVTGTPQRLRVRLIQPGTPPRRWRIRFTAQGRLRVAGDDDSGDDDSSDDDSDAHEDPQLSPAPPRASSPPPPPKAPPPTPAPRTPRDTRWDSG